MSLYGLTYLLAAADTTGTTQTGQTQTVQDPRNSMAMTVIFIGGMVLLMWLMIFRPQQKRAKEMNTMLKALRAGDKIITTSGIVAVVLSLKDKTISIRSNDTKLEILKSAVAEVTERGGDTTPS
jgi:preprotein translocase subunit YajC